MHLKIEVLWKLFREQQWVGSYTGSSVLTQNVTTKQTKINERENCPAGRPASHYNPWITLGSLIPIDNYTIYWYIDNWTWCRDKANYLRILTVMDQLEDYKELCFYGYCYVSWKEPLEGEWSWNVSRPQYTTFFWSVTSHQS